MRSLFRNGLKVTAFSVPLRLAASCVLTVLQVAIGISAHAQLQGNQQNVSPNYTIAARGAYYCLWQNAEPAATNGQGQVSYRTNCFTELATGLNYLSNGWWMPSVPAIQITQTGGAATNGQQQVIFNPHINVSNAVQITTPDAVLFKSHIMGLSYYDASSGSNVLFAELQDTTGQLVTSNQVVYPNAFGGCDADVRYTYTLAGIEQDIVVQQQLPNPSAYSLNPDTTWLQVWTEFTDPPTPTIETILDGTDERLDFGMMKMERGKAFIIGSESNSVPVDKAWTVTGGRTFLVEQVQFDSVVDQLQTLPPYGGGGTGYQPIRNFPKKLPAEPALASRAGGKLKLAKTHAPEKGLVLDFSLTGSITNLTLQSDMTYLVSSSVNLYSNTTIEGGTVVKYTNTGTASLNIYGPVNCKTGPYRMAVFTAVNDNTVGIGLASGSPTGYYAQNALDNNCTTSSINLQYIRISYANFGYVDVSGLTNRLKHCQFVNNDTAVELSGGVLNLQNTLINNTGMDAIFGLGATINGVNLTVDQAGKLFDNPFGSALNLTNCLLTAITNAGNSHGGSNNYTNNVGGVYQTAGAGSHYLADGSPYRNLGITNIDTNLLSDLQNLTTYPPLVFNTNTYTADTTLNPQAQRDYDTPDVGYHYAPLDYLGTYLVNGVTLTLTNGVALGQTNADMIWLQNGSQLVSQGMPNGRNYIAFYTLVQEQPSNLSGTNPYTASSLPIDTLHTNYTINPSIFLRFTTICMANPCDIIMNSDAVTSNTLNYMVNAFTMKDSEIYGAFGLFTMTPAVGQTITLGNNIFQYPYFDISSGGTISAYNNLFTGNDTLVEFDSGTLQNNAFDVCGNGVILSGTLSNTAYLNMDTNNIGQPILANDIVTNLTWVIGPLGNYYQATNSPLLHKGSTTADQLGLYHYTTSTNEVPETTNKVSIGYHYVALGTDGQPLDSNTNGFPDYLEDANGNGVVDSGETSWTNANDLGLQVLITQPPNNSTLP